MKRFKIPSTFVLYFQSHVTPWVAPRAHLTRSPFVCLKEQINDMIITRSRLRRPSAPQTCDFQWTFMTSWGSVGELCMSVCCVRALCNTCIASVFSRDSVCCANPPKTCACVQHGSEHRVNRCQGRSRRNLGIFERPLGEAQTQLHPRDPRASGAPQCCPLARTLTRNLARTTPHASFSEATLSRAG